MWKLLLVIGIIFLCIGLIDGNRFRVVKENFELDKIKKDFTFVMISDLHCKVYGKHNEKVIDKINEIQPDFIVLAGDMITSDAHEDTTAVKTLINQLSEQYPIYYALGNHETKLRVKTEQFGDKYEDFISAISNANTNILRNEHVILPEYGVRITGLELDRYYFSKFKKRSMEQETLKAYVGEADEENCNLLIAHHPDYFEEYAAWGADLVLSGHIHGGIMRLPLLGGVIAPSYILFPKYDGGVFKHNASSMLLGRGLGAHTFKLRFFNPAELYVVNCLRK